MNPQKLLWNAGIGAATGFAPWARGARWRDSRFPEWVAGGNVRRDIANNPAFSVGTGIGVAQSTASEIVEAAECPCK